MNKLVTVQIPEELHHAIAHFAETRQGWDVNRLATASFALFLLQNRASNDPTESAFQKQASRIYLDTLFNHGETTKVTDQGAAQAGAPATPE